MTVRRSARRAGLATGLGVLVLVVAACGTSSSNAARATSAPSGGSSTASTSLAVAQTALGPVVVDAAGRTVYLLTADSPDHATCSTVCQSVWPVVPVPASATPTGTGITAELGRTTTPGGGSTATVGGWPVYTFAQDHAPGDTNGEGITSFGGTWYAVSPAGAPVKPSSPSSTGGGYVRGY